MTKSLMSVIAPFMLMPILAFGSGRKEATPEKRPKTESEYVTLRGKAYGECYMPATGNYDSYIESRYSFSICINPFEINNPIKSFRVIPTKDISLESVDAIINSEHGTLVEVNVKREDAEKQFLTISADNIRVPDQ